VSALQWRFERYLNGAARWRRPREFRWILSLNCSLQLPPGSQDGFNYILRWMVRPLLWPKLLTALSKAWLTPPHLFFILQSNNLLYPKVSTCLYLLIWMMSWYNIWWSRRTSYTRFCCTLVGIVFIQKRLSILASIDTTWSLLPSKYTYTHLLLKGMWGAHVRWLFRENAGVTQDLDTDPTLVSPSHYQLYLEIRLER